MEELKLIVDLLEGAAGDVAAVAIVWALREAVGWIVVVSLIMFAAIKGVRIGCEHDAKMAEIGLEADLEKSMDSFMARLAEAIDARYILSTEKEIILEMVRDGVRRAKIEAKIAENSTRSENMAKRVTKAKKKVNELVKKGVRINPRGSSNTYKNAILKHGTTAEKLEARKAARQAATRKASGRKK